MKTDAEKREADTRRKATEEQIRKKQAEQRQEELERAFSNYRHERARTIFKGKSKAFQTRRRNAFLAKMQEEKNDILLRAHAKDGWESPMVDACFITELVDELLTEEHETSIKAFEFWQEQRKKAG